MNMNDFNDKNYRINNSKKMDFDSVVYQHKKEYIVNKKSWHKRVYVKGVFSSYNDHYLRFFLFEKKNIYPSFKKSPVFTTDYSQKFLDPHRNYPRYNKLLKRYKKKARYNIRFSQYRFREKQLHEFYYVRFYKRRRYRRGSYFGYKFGRDSSMFDMLYKVMIPTKLLMYLQNNELRSFGNGPFTDTSYYHLDHPKFALNFHRSFLNQYNEFLFVKNEKVEKSFLILKNYLGTDKYIYDALYTMPGVFWRNKELLEQKEQNLFQLNNCNNFEISKNFNLDFLEIEYIDELNMASAMVEHHFESSYADVSFHLDPGNTKFFTNVDLKELDEKPPIWKAMTRVWYGYEREHMMEINDDYYYIFRIAPYACASMFYPAFYTKKKITSSFSGL